MSHSEALDRIADMLAQHTLDAVDGEAKNPFNSAYAEGAKTIIQMNMETAQALGIEVQYRNAYYQMCG